MKRPIRILQNSNKTEPIKEPICFGFTPVSLTAGRFSYVPRSAASSCRTKSAKVSTSMPPA